MGEDVHVGAGGVWEVSVISIQFCWEPKVVILKVLNKQTNFGDVKPKPLFSCVPNPQPTKRLILIRH